MALTYMHIYLREQVLSTQNTPIHIMISISFSVYATQNLYVLLNSLGISVYMMKFV